jgi:phytoene synthase
MALEPTKSHQDENFPVASLLLSRDLRGPVLAFYQFVRQADDIADAPTLEADEKLRRLDALEAALDRGDPAEPAASALAAIGGRHPAGPEQARLMLGAFRQDATKRRYADWDELVAYCERSANPVGRFLLALHGESDVARAPADALCTALQILNHLQDLVPDRDRLDRVYMPEPWMDQAGGEERFFASGPSPARRAVLDAALDRVDALVDEADALVPRLKSRRLGAQSGVTVALARRLAAKLRAADPVQERVALKPVDFARGFGQGSCGPPGPGCATRCSRGARSRNRARRSSSACRRCRASAAAPSTRSTPIAGSSTTSPTAPRRRRRSAGRSRLAARDRDPGRSLADAVGRELAFAVARFGLPVAELHALLDGMETDAAERVRLPDDAALDLYCRRVAGAVGVLSIHIFGAPGATEFAVTLGRTLQLVNVLRDIDEDAAMDRVYVPLSHLPGPRRPSPRPRSCAIPGSSRPARCCPSGPRRGLRPPIACSTGSTGGSFARRS